MLKCTTDSIRYGVMNLDGDNKSGVKNATFDETRPHTEHENDNRMSRLEYGIEMGTRGKYVEFYSSLNDLGFIIDDEVFDAVVESQEFGCLPYWLLYREQSREDSIAA